ncbi:MAG: hypothetical protein IJN46_07590, partial [Lachnospiraceae bacterium]|nr:hypothetical protein [Lachnospiraceae bacterium]
LNDTKKVYVRKKLSISEVRCGEIIELYRLAVLIPRVEKPTELTLSVRLEGGNIDAENKWSLYVFPKAAKLPKETALKQAGVTVASEMDEKTLAQKLRKGERVLLFGTGPFSSEKTEFQLSIAGRTNGHLATVIKEHVLMEDFPHDGYLGWQFREMLNGGNAVILDLPRVPFAPIVEIATSYKNAKKEALLFEYQVGEGKLCVCSLNLRDDDPSARWLKERIVSYVMSEQFNPSEKIGFAELYELCGNTDVKQGINENEAQNKNDITMKRN